MKDKILCGTFSEQKEVSRSIPLGCACLWVAEVLHCGWFERSRQSTASISVNRLPSAHFYWVSCVWLYLLTFIECVKYTSFALTSYLCLSYISSSKPCHEVLEVYDLYDHVLHVPLCVYCLNLRFQPSIVSLCRWEEESSDWVWGRMKSEKDGDFTLCVSLNCWLPAAQTRPLQSDCRTKSLGKDKSTWSSPKYRN